MVCAALDVARAQDDADIQEPERDLSNVLGIGRIADAHAQFAAIFSTDDRWLSDPEDNSDVVTYMGVDGWRFGASAYAGVESLPPWLGGFVIRGFASDGLDEFRTPNTSYRSETARASILPGYRLSSGKLDVKVFLGGDFMMRTPLRPATERSMVYYGVRATIDIWWEPSEDWMVSGSASATTIETGASARLASGWRLPFAWIGPEMLATRDIYSTQVRAGAHLTGFKFGSAEWSIAGGYAYDSFKRSSPYARIGFTLRP